MNELTQETHEETVLQLRPDVDVTDLLKSRGSTNRLLQALLSPDSTERVRAVLSQEDGAAQLKAFVALLGPNTILVNPEEWIRRLGTQMPWGLMLQGVGAHEKQSIFRTIVTTPKMPRLMRYQLAAYSTQDDDHAGIIRGVFAQTSLLLRDFVELMPPSSLNVIRNTPRALEVWVRELEVPGKGKEEPYERVCEEKPESHVRLVIRDLLRPPVTGDFAWLQGPEMLEMLERERRATEKAGQGVRGGIGVGSSFPWGYGHFFVLLAMEWHPAFLLHHHADIVHRLVRHPEKEVRLAAIRAIGQSRTGPPAAGEDIESSRKNGR